MGFPLGSLPNLSQPAQEQDEIGAPPAERYVDMGLLGVGGMGEVRAVHDTHLDRQVARKTPRADVPGAEAALAREAALTAALEHPGIVPVYDSGCDEAGQPWYTMRLVRGRTLRAVLSDTPELSRRLGLVRTVLGVVEVVAYAHERGVVHRDLKTTNVLVGEHGEVKVVDWGLATADRATAGGGTPATMAPEQARGEPAMSSSDVWSLGVMLCEVLGAEVAAGRHLDLPSEGVPPALRAIVERCLRADPSERYPDATALAADLTRFLDGRLVQAHDYSPAEHLWRFLGRHRVAVVVGLLALGAVAAVSLAAAQRVFSERSAALAAEQHALEAWKRSDHNLAHALVLAARTAAADGRRPEAELLAASALELLESPEARGVLAATYASPRPRATFVEVAPCAGTRRVGPTGWLCVEQGRLSTAHWSVAVASVDAVFAGDDVIVTQRGNRGLALDGASGSELLRFDELPSSFGLVSGHTAAWLPVGRHLYRIDPRQGSVLATTPCDQDVIAAVSEAASGEVVVACGADRLLMLGGSGLPFTSVGPEASVQQLAVGPGGAVAVGTHRGRVYVLDSAGERFSISLGSAITGLWWTRDGTRLVATQRQGSPVVLQAHTGADLGRLPAGGILGMDGPAGLVVADGRRWELSDLRPVVLGDGAGITGVLEGRTGHVLVTRGDGTVESLEPSTGAVLGRESWSTRPLKGLTRLPGERGYAVTGVEGGTRQLGEDMAVGAILSTGAARRIVQLGPDLLLLSYLQPALLRPGGTVRQLEGIETTWFDVGADSSATRAAALSDTGELWTLEAGGEARSLGLFASASAVDVTSDGGAVLGEKGALVVVAPDGQVRRLTQGEALVVDLAVSPGDRWAAVGGLDGVVRVVDLETGATRAVLEGHRERVASLAWTGPEALLSSSWDGTVRVWDLSVLHRPAEQLVAEARTAWGLDLDAALEAVGP